MHRWVYIEYTGRRNLSLAAYIMYDFLSKLFRSKHLMVYVLWMFFAFTMVWIAHVRTYFPVITIDASPIERLTSSVEAIEARETAVYEPAVKLPVSEPTPVYTTGTAYSGSLADWLLKLRTCESGGNYSINTGNGYYGAYQADLQTWGNYQGFSRPDLAPPDVQDQFALELRSRRGTQPWPTCG